MTFGPVFDVPRNDAMRTYIKAIKEMIASVRVYLVNIGMLASTVTITLGLSW